VVIRNSTKSFWESFILFSVALLVALFLYIHGQEDAVSELTNRSETVQNGWVNLVLFLLI
jgi:hypothetical protein